MHGKVDQISEQCFYQHLARKTSFLAHRFQVRVRKRKYLTWLLSNGNACAVTGSLIKNQLKVSSCTCWSVKHIVGFSGLALMKTPVVHPTCIDLVLLTLVLSGFFFVRLIVRQKKPAHFLKGRQRKWKVKLCVVMKRCMIRGFLKSKAIYYVQVSSENIRDNEQHKPRGDSMPTFLRLVCVSFHWS